MRITSVPFFSGESISMVSPRVCPILTLVLVIPVPVYIQISPSHSAMIDTASSGNMSLFSDGVSLLGENRNTALSPIKGCPSARAILIVESRLALATVESAVMIPVSVRSATRTHTL